MDALVESDFAVEDTGARAETLAGVLPALASGFTLSVPALL